MNTLDRVAYWERSIARTKKDLAEYESKLRAELEAEPKIVEFDAMVNAEHGVVFVEGEELRPFSTCLDPAHFAVSKDPFAAIPGVLVASGVLGIDPATVNDLVLYSPKGGTGWPILQYLKDINAKPGHIVAVINPLED